MKFKQKQQALPDHCGHNKQDGALQLQYQGHLVHLEAHRDPSLCDWTVTAYIEFNENLVVHTIVLKPPDVFRSKQTANKFISRQARTWIEDRLFSKRSLKESVAAELCETAND
jgi:hypothetical protein